MSPYFWRANEKAAVCRMYEAGVPLRDISAEVGRTTDAIRRAVGKWKLHRPKGHVGIEMRENLAFPRIRAALEQSGGMTVAQLCEHLGMFRSVVLKAIKAHRAELHIGRWIPTTRKPAAVWCFGASIDAAKPVKHRRRTSKPVNPFLIAAGEIEVPRGRPGRVFRIADDDKYVRPT